jgi:hypothetical protein
MAQHKWHKEIKAWADSAEIEERWISQNTEEDEWREAQTSPMWDCDGLEFRIKPQPKTPKQAWDEELTRSYKETIIERLRNDDKFYDEVFSAYDNAKDNEIKPQPKEPQYLYVYLGVCNKADFEYFVSELEPSVMQQFKYIGKIKLEE